MERKLLRSAGSCGMLFSYSSNVIDRNFVDLLNSFFVFIAICFFYYFTGAHFLSFSCESPKPHCISLSLKIAIILRLGDDFFFFFFYCFYPKPMCTTLFFLLWLWFVGFFVAHSTSGKATSTCLALYETTPGALD